MTRKTTMRLLALVSGLLALACSDARTPVEPSNGSAPQFSVASDAAHARHEALKQELEERKADFKALKDANKDELKAAREEWQAWKRDWKEQHKLEQESWRRAHPGEKGGPEVELLRCEPRAYDADVAIIGPNGGTLHMGAHELVIPKGALDQEVLITAEAPTTSLVNVRFGPEGLQFRDAGAAHPLVQGVRSPDERRVPDRVPGPGQSNPRAAEFDGPEGRRQGRGRHRPLLAVRDRLLIGGRGGGRVAAPESEAG